MTEAFERFAALLKVSDRMLVEASPEDLAECCRILALNVAHYRSRFADLPLEDSLNLLATEMIDDDQAKWLVDGMEIIVGVSGMLAEEKLRN